MRLLKALVSVVTIALPTASGVQAQEKFPAHTMTMVVPFAAGGPTDVCARVVAAKMSQILGQAVVVDNIGGAGGVIGVAKVAYAPPDGYTMVMGTVGTHAQNQTLFAKPKYNAVTDFTPVALLADAPLVLMTRKDLPVTDLQSFIAFTKTNQKTMTYASSGTGAALHIGTVMLNMAMGVDVTHVPYRGGAPATNDLIGKKVDYMLDVISTAKPQIDAQTVSGIAVLQEKRSPVLPNVPTADEQGLKGFAAYTWNALFLPKGASASVVKVLNEAAVQAANDPDAKRKLEELGYTVASGAQSTPDYLAKFVPAEIEKWAVPIKASGTQLE